jgi:hypothetical protein
MGAQSLLQLIPVGREGARRPVWMPPPWASTPKPVCFCVVSGTQRAVDTARDDYDDGSSVDDDGNKREYEQPVEPAPSFERDVPQTPPEFPHLVVSDTTLSLWGKRIVSVRGSSPCVVLGPELQAGGRAAPPPPALAFPLLPRAPLPPPLTPQVALSGSVAFARSDTGQLFTWGGRDMVWNSVEKIQDRGTVVEPTVCTPLPEAQCIRGVALTPHRRLNVGAGVVPPPPPHPHLPNPQVETRGPANLTPRSKLLIGAAQMSKQLDGEAGSKEISLCVGLERLPSAPHRMLPAHAPPPLPMTLWAVWTLVCPGMSGATTRGLSLSPSPR